MTQEMPEHVENVKETLASKGGDFERLSDEMDYLWENPDEFENGDVIDTESFQEDHLMLVFHLGVCFGTDYEHAYPRESDEWRD